MCYMFRIRNICAFLALFSSHSIVCDFECRLNHLNNLLNEANKIPFVLHPRRERNISLSGICNLHSSTYCEIKMKNINIQKLKRNIFIYFLMKQKS